MQRTSKLDLVDAIKNLGIKPYDTVLLHSALYRFGIVDFSAKDLILELSKYLYKGDLILPTFTYSFRRNEVYDVRKSLPDKRLGVLSKEIFLHDHYRNECPQFSFCSLTKTSKNLLDLESPNCFGPYSVFDKMCDANVKILSLGVDFSSGLTMFLNFEKLSKVPYRCNLELSGELIRADGSSIKANSIHF
ncbi:AAC(3) family N-acetyltransferase, partial [Planktomarina temperata]|nr:AAC(3) family N-acetyltransferase [Planktomarina temperata]